ncbi:uncharacterized protein LOC113388554 [Ctenocephalides felis]|uniref:uncharacterized protein LOC113388554 n=1 Tax=Ctenocephalides felis TaxID=7515 RepID=UPI000E6E1884|nr:uncharacterized protein LOC113388554 [Ctenocephalides felis]
MLTSSSGHQQQPLQSQATATNSIDHQINVPMTNLEEGGTVAAAAATGGVGGGAGGAAAIGAEYASSLADLTVNSKPLINMLTMLAEEKREIRWNHCQSNRDSPCRGAHFHSLCSLKRLPPIPSTTN